MQEHPETEPDFSQVARVIHCSESLTRTFVTHVLDEVTRRAIEREERRWRSMKLAAGVAAIVGVAGVSGVTTLAVDKAIETPLALVKHETELKAKEVQLEADRRRTEFEKNALVRDEEREKRTSSAISALEATASRFDDLIQRQAKEAAGRELAEELYVLATTIADGMTPSQRDRVMQLLRELVPYGDLTSSRRFAASLVGLMETFRNAVGQEVHVREMERLYREVLTADSNVTTNLMQYFGRRAIAEAADHGTLSQETQDRFWAYSQACRSHRFPEYAWPHEVLLYFALAKQKSTRRIRDAFKESEAFSKSERALCVVTLVQLSRAEDIGLDGTGEGEAIERTGRAFITTFRESIARFVNTPDSVAAAIATARRLSRPEGMVARIQELAARE